MIGRGRRRDERGATAVEYALLVALVVLGLMAPLHFVSQAMQGTYTGMCRTLNDTPSPDCP